MVDREALIQDIYEAAVLPEQWPKVLEQIGGRCSDSNGLAGATSCSYLSTSSPFGKNTHAARC